MRFQTSDPDIETVLRRIERGTIDLQPDFQRGEVWSVPKKQRLIDTILRRWHVPPVHLVAKGGGQFDVLDGQQRLTAIRDFVHGLFPVDGSIEPEDPYIKGLDSLRYSRLPDEVRNEFDTFAIRIFELHDYQPDEPHELFFRLNQPIVLTEAEKRNAFIGQPRNQVKDLVEWAESAGMTPERIGFSNARMSYDDLIARFLLTIEQDTLLEKITASKVTLRYRAKASFSEEVIEAARMAIGYLLDFVLTEDFDSRRRPNKATIHTWLCMIAKLASEELVESQGNRLVDSILRIEFARFDRGHEDRSKQSIPLAVFHDRATARVADVTSVILRDLCGWMIFVTQQSPRSAPAGFLSTAAEAWDIVNLRDDADKGLADFAAIHGWGRLGWF